MLPLIRSAAHIHMRHVSTVRCTAAIKRPQRRGLPEAKHRYGNRDCG
jgi:hypothetical protein